MLLLENLVTWYKFAFAVRRKRDAYLPYCWSQQNARKKEQGQLISSNLIDIVLGQFKGK